MLSSEVYFSCSCIRAFRCSSVWALAIASTSWCSNTSSGFCTWGSWGPCVSPTGSTGPPVLPVAKPPVPSPVPPKRVPSGSSIASTIGVVLVSFSSGRGLSPFPWDVEVPVPVPLVPSVGSGEKGFSGVIPKRGDWSLRSSSQFVRKSSSYRAVSSMYLSFRPDCASFSSLSPSPYVAESIIPSEWRRCSSSRWAVILSCSSWWPSGSRLFASRPTASST